LRDDNKNKNEHFIGKSGKVRLKLQRQSSSSSSSSGFLPKPPPSAAAMLGFMKGTPGLLQA
jgi:hypothetical protein